MPPVTPTSTTPPRHRHMNWSDGPPTSYPYDYDGSHRGYSRGNASPGAHTPAPAGYYPPYASRGSHPPPDYWSYDGNVYGDIPPGSDREAPENARMHLRGAPYRPPYPYQSPHGDRRRPHFGRPPASPPGAYDQSRDLRHQRAFPPLGDGVPKDKRTGDPLSILANVSAGMTGKDGRKHNHKHSYEGRCAVPMPAPTSPLQRRTRPSPITPNHTPQEKSQRAGSRHTTPGSARAHEHQPHPDYHAEAGYTDYSAGPYYSPRHRGGEYGSHSFPEGAPPALVEHGSFDSQGEITPYRDGAYSPKTPPPAAGYYGEHPPHYGYWDGYPPHASGGAYPPPRWSYSAHHESYHPEYGFEGQAERYDRYTYQRSSMPGAHNPAPYTYVQQPRLEEKTVLRKKFSWKHYPELERFLIANRDEYLKHSNMNYTAEQKQYNNWLTERLLEVAARHNYVFDPDDFNFVAIRDRIRCYYKSYVQTARKRGLKLPEKKD